jgi:hypothetical protein
MRCSFFEPPPKPDGNNHADPIARVLLGASDSKNDVGIFLKYAPVRLVFMTTTTDLALAISDVILGRARSETRFYVDTDVIRDTFAWAYRIVFNSCEADAIGGAYGEAMHILLYNVAAFTIHRFDISNEDCGYVGRCTRLLADFAISVSPWLPPSGMSPERVRGRSGCHALLLCIEFCDVSALKSPKARTDLRFLWFVDALCGLCLDESVSTHLKDAENECSSFGWLAFSPMWGPLITSCQAVGIGRGHSGTLLSKIHDALSESYVASYTKSRGNARGNEHKHVALNDSSKSRSRRVTNDASSTTPSPQRAPSTRSEYCGVKRRRAENAGCVVRSLLLGGKVDDI